MHHHANEAEQQGGDAARNPHGKENSVNPKPTSISERNSEPDEKKWNDDELVVLLSGRPKKTNDLPLSLLFHDALNTLLGITWHFSGRKLDVNDKNLVSWLGCELKETRESMRVVALLFITAFHIDQNLGREETFFAALGDFIKQTHSKDPALKKTVLKGLEEELDVFPEFGATRKLPKDWTGLMVSITAHISE
jgi:hypothetical protein